MIFVIWGVSTVMSVRAGAGMRPGMCAQSAMCISLA